MWSGDMHLFEETNEEEQVGLCSVLWTQRVVGIKQDVVVVTSRDFFVHWDAHHDRQGPRCSFD